jgi:hypothetical protein
MLPNSMSRLSSTLKQEDVESSSLLHPSLCSTFVSCHLFPRNPVVDDGHAVNILNDNPVQGITVPKGKPELLEGWAPKVAFSNQLSRELFGIEYKRIEDTVRNTVTHALEVGWHQ